MNTYLNILNTDLKTSEPADPLKVLDREHGRFLEKHLAAGNLTFTQLNLIQKATIKDRDAFTDCNKVYN